MASPFYVRSNRGTQWPTSSSYYNRPFSNVDPPLTLFRTGPNKGLCNLGNTCFMNSAIQCLSYTHPLTVYFLEQEYKKDINEDNPLGMGGNVAEAYHKLLIEMWSEQYWSYSPSPFKSVIERFAPQFCGHKQHDSQELLTFLLDGLHEDLNRVREKPDVDMDIVSEEREEEAIAAEFWDKHLQRNQSVVVDLFQGQLKTAMTCGHCNKVSKIFDPAMFLSLTLPATRINNIKVTLVRADPSAYMVEYSVEVYLEGTMADLLKKLSDMTHIKMENMMAVTYESQFTRIYTLLDKLTDVNKGNQTMYIYELNGPVNSSDWEHVPLYHLTDDSDYQSGSYYKPLPPPNIVSLRKKWSQEQCRAAVMDKCSSLCIHYGCEEGETHRSHTRKKSKTNRETNWFQKLEEKIIYFKGDTCVLWNWSKDDIYDPKPTLRDNSSSRSANSPTLTNCLDLFTSEKRMGETVPWYCSLCKTSGKATRKCDIWKLPQILIIHLTRFSHDRFGREKLDTFVDFPINNLNLMDYVKNPQHPTVTYDLFAVSNHHGWLTGGHYTACCKNSTNNQWYKYSDSHVIKIPEEDVVTQDAYILFYQSCSSRHATAPTPLHPPLEQSEQNVHPPKKSTLAEEIQCISTEAATRKQLLQKLHEANARATAAEKIVENAEQQIKQLQSKFDEFEKVRQERQAILHYATAAEQRSKSWLVSAQDVEITSEVIGIRESVQIHTAYMKVNATKIQLACQSQKERFEQEIVIALRLSHPNLVSFYRAIQQERETTILSEPMLTNLRNEVESIRQHPEKPIPRKYLLSIAIDVSSALNYIHHLTPQPVIHRDLKSANVFLKCTSNGSLLAKISTLSHFQGQLQPQNRQESLAYAAPESSDPALISPKVDIFSFGVLLMEMFSASFPFIEHQPDLIECIDAPIRNLIESCMECDHNMRPSAAQLVDCINRIES